MPSSMLCLQVMQASFGSSIKTLYGQQYTLSVASPADGCKTFNNTGNVARTVVLVLRGSCYFAVKVGRLSTHMVFICGMQCNKDESPVAWLVHPKAFSKLKHHGQCSAVSECRHRMLRQQAQWLCWCMMTRSQITLCQHPMAPSQALGFLPAQFLAAPASFSSAPSWSACLLPSHSAVRTRLQAESRHARSYHAFVML